MRINLWFVLASAVAGVLLTALVDGPRLNPLKLFATPAVAEEADTRAVPPEPPPVSSARAPVVAAPVPSIERPAAANALPVVEPPPASNRPRINRRDYLEARIDQQAPDPLWEIDIRRGLVDALSSLQHARVLTANCSAEICRVEFTGDEGPQNVETLIDAITNMDAVQGERMVEIDDEVTPPVGIAYFSRRGSISLAPPDVLAAHGMN